MRYIASYLLLQIGGNANPTAADITKLLGTVGVEVDSGRLQKLLSELSGKSIDEVIAEGSAKLASVPSGGAVSASAPAAGGGGAAAQAAPAEQEQKKEEEKEESDDDMGFGLFD